MSRCADARALGLTELEKFLAEVAREWNSAPFVDGVALLKHGMWLTMITHLYIVPSVSVKYKRMVKYGTQLIKQRI